MSGLFSSGTLEQIRAASDIVDVIGSSLPLKRAGANFVALCPFHKEKTPSFNVNPHRQIFHCFGCHKGGDVFKFVEYYENITFPEAVRRLADRAKIPLEYEQSPGGQQTRHLKETLLQIHEQITQRWQNALANEAAGQIAREYLAKRGVSAEAIQLFRLGYAPDLWDDTVNWARSKGHEPDVVEKAGLILRKEGGDHYYDRFRGRLMFPICDEQGRVIGFSGRILSGDEKAAKYVNSPETPIFTKSKVFFGLDKSKRALLDAGFAIVCEGQLDLIACFMAGVQNVVAPQGTAFTPDHARILKRYVDEVVLCFDSDEAGQNAAVRSLDHLLASGLAVRVAVVPAPHDPDSFIKASGGEAFRSLVEKADGFFDYYLKRLCAQNDVKTDKGRMLVVRSMLLALKKTGSKVLFDKHAHDLTFKLGLSFKSVVDEYAKILVQQSGDSTEEQTEDAPRPSPQEIWLLRLLIQHEELAEWCARHVDPNWIQHPLIRQIVNKRMDLHRQQKWSSLGAFLDECETQEMRSLITEAVAKDRPIPNPEQQLADTVKFLRNQCLDREIKALRYAAIKPETSESEKLELNRKELELIALKKEDALKVLKNRVIKGRPD